MASKSRQQVWRQQATGCSRQGCGRQGGRVPQGLSRQGDISTKDKNTKSETSTIVSVAGERIVLACALACHGIFHGMPWHDMAYATACHGIYENLAQRGRRPSKQCFFRFRSETYVLFPEGVCFLCVLCFRSLDGFVCSLPWCSEPQQLGRSQQQKKHIYIYIERYTQIYMYACIYIYISV